MIEKIKKSKKIIAYLFLYILTIFMVFLSLTKKVDNGLGNESIKTFLEIFIVVLAMRYLKSIFLAIMAPWQEVKKVIRENKYPATNFKPLTSILVPAWNEEVGLLRTVKTILKSKYKNIELIVVNDGSTDNSDKIMREFYWKYNRAKKTSDINLKYYYKENGGKGSALNYALKKSTGDIIITVDADCILTPDTIGNFIKPFANPKVDAAVGNVKIGNTDSVITTIQFLEFLSSFYAKKAEDVLETIYIVGGAAAAFRRKVFKKIGNYNTKNITEDIDLSLKSRKVGMNIVFADDAIVYTEGASTMDGLIKQRSRWKIGWFQTIYEHSEFIFSFKKEHNKLLTWVMIPFAYFGNVQLIFEPWFIIFLYFYSYSIQDFSPFIAWISIEAVMMFFIMIVERKWIKFRMLGLIPIIWVLFYITSYVEYRSLLATISRYITKKEAKWQKWERTGISKKIEKEVT